MDRVRVVKYEACEKRGSVQQQTVPDVVAKLVNDSRIEDKKGLQAWRKRRETHVQRKDVHAQEQSVAWSCNPEIEALSESR